MDIFMDAFHGRKISLLQLLQSENRFFTILELSDVLSVTPITVEKAVDSLIEDFQELSMPCTIIKNDEKIKKVKVNIGNTFSIEELKWCYMTNNFLFQALDDMFHRQFGAVKTYAEKNFTSLTMAYKKFSSMETVLKSFDLKFNFSADFELEGTETQIRYFYFNLYWSVYDGHYWPFQIEKERLTSVVDEIEILQGRQLPLARREFYYFFIGVSITRLIQGNYIYDIPIDVDSFVQYDFEAVRPFYDLLHYVLDESVDTEIFLNELSFLGLISYAFEHQRHFPEKINFHRLRLINAMPDNIVFDSVNYFMRTLDENSSIRLKDGDYNDLYLNIVNLHTRILFFKGEYKDFQGINTRFLSKRLETFFSRFFDELLSILRKNKRFSSIFEGNSNLANIYTMLFSSTLRLGEHIPSIKVGVVSLYGDRRIDYYRRVIQFCWFEEVEVTIDPDETVDLIVTDRNYDELSEKKCPILVWNEQPSVRDIDRLTELLDSVLIYKVQERFWINFAN